MRCRMCRMTWFLVLKVGSGNHFITFFRYCQPEYQTTIILPTGILNGVSNKNQSQSNKNQSQSSPKQWEKSSKQWEKNPRLWEKSPTAWDFGGTMLLQLFFLKCCCSWFNCCFCWRSRRFAMLHFAWFLSMKRAKMGLSEHHPTHPTSHPTLRKPLIISTLSASVGNVGN